MRPWWSSTIRRAKDNPSAVSFGGIEGAEDVGQMVGRDAATVVGYLDNRGRSKGLHGDGDFSVRVDRLQCIQQQVEHHLMNLIAVVLDFRKGRIFTQRDLD
jgi:hypothetical protein